MLPKTYFHFKWLFENSPQWTDAKGNNLLHLAAKYIQDKIEFSELVELAKHAGMSLDAVNKKGNTPLHNAVNCLNIITCDILIAQGAKTNIKNNEYSMPIDMFNKWASMNLMRLPNKFKQKLVKPLSACRAWGEALQVLASSKYAVAATKAENSTPVTSEADPLLENVPAEPVSTPCCRIL